MLPRVNAVDSEGIFNKIIGVYPEELERIEPQTAICNVCREVITRDARPVMTNCGHIFCILCLYIWAHDQKQDRCPLCNQRPNLFEEFQWIDFLDNNDNVRCAHCETFMDGDFKPRTHSENRSASIPIGVGTRNFLKTYPSVLLYCDLCAAEQQANGQRAFIHYNVN